MRLFSKIGLIGICAAAIFFGLGCAKKGSTGGNNPPVSDTTAAPPALRGQLVFHRYDSYGDTAQLYLFDFSGRKLTFLSRDWGLFDPINAHFSPDGLQLVFMAQTLRDGKWDIFTWTVGSPGAPRNLTASDGCRDEDAQFSPDGKSICFKQTAPGGVGVVKLMDLSGNITATVTRNGVESGMPCFTANGSAIVYARGAGDGSDIFRVNPDGSGDAALAATASVDEYYPVRGGGDTILYARWNAAANHNDQIYAVPAAGGNATRLSFNQANADYSDPAPASGGWLVFSCDKPGGSGAYDLYLTNTAGGAVWSLSYFLSTINSDRNELGAAYAP